MQGRIGNEPVAWGLGIGIDHTPNGTCFRQWCDNMDFESYLLGCPDARIAVVIFTNSSRGRIVAREVIAKALGD